MLEQRWDEIGPKQEEREKHCKQLSRQFISVGGKLSEKRSCALSPSSSARWLGVLNLRIQLVGVKENMPTWLILCALWLYEARGAPCGQSTSRDCDWESLWYRCQEFWTGAMKIQGP